MTQAFNLSQFANKLNTSGQTNNSGLQNTSVTVTAGTGLSGGGAVALGGSVSLANAGVTSIAAGTGISVTASTGAITIANTVIPRGLGQNGEIWRDVKASRTSGTVYTNTNGYPIMVIAAGTASSGAPTITVVVNGVTLITWSFPYGGGQPVSFIVPTGATYSITFAAGTIYNSWVELY